MSLNSIKCAVCEKASHAIVSLPVVQATLIKWSQILNTTSLLTAPRYKKICLDHFAEKWHNALKDPSCRRSPFCFPLPYHHDPFVDSVSIPNTSADSVLDSVSNTVDAVNSFADDHKKRSISPLPNEYTLHNRSQTAFGLQITKRKNTDSLACVEGL